MIAKLEIDQYLLTHKKLSSQTVKSTKTSMQTIQILLMLIPLMVSAAESPRFPKSLPLIDMSLPVHQKPKTHPELSDPVLGDQAQVVEWAWSPQYAKRYNLPVQEDGLKDGGLWAIGISVERKQYQNYQRYTCSISGVMSNKLPIRTPPGDMYMINPGYIWESGLPGTKNNYGGQMDYTPGQAAWARNPKNQAEKELPYSIQLKYLRFYRYYEPDLAFFEIEGACGYFRDPLTFRHEIGFPGIDDGRVVKDKRLGRFTNSQATTFVIPDGLMKRIYSYILDSYDWSSCFGHRTSGASISTRALVSKRFGKLCEPIKPLNQTSTNK